MITEAQSYVYEIIYGNNMEILHKIEKQYKEQIVRCKR